MKEQDHHWASHENITQTKSLLFKKKLEHILNISVLFHTRCMQIIHMKHSL
jgi:hypothetical protein